jgi:hypothetical protein
MPPDKRSGPERPLRDIATAKEASTTESLPHEGDPRRIGELLGDWLDIRMTEVDDLVDEARSRVDALPDQRVLFSLVGEVIVLLRALELDVAELRKAVRR